ncbi:MAG: AAA family ATPase [Thermoguttaceae bacterium]
MSEEKNDLPTPPKTRDLRDVLNEFGQHCQLMQDELGKVIIGQSSVVRQILAAIFTRGHCLLEGVPGLAKTLMVSTISRILDIDFKRIQFTPDLMPSDITGTSVLDENENGKRSFRFVPGPVFTNILLADEINRTPPKTQAALLQAMQEREVTIGQTTYPLPDPFFTIATQNPIEQEGTYPLPEAQLDRFMFNIKIDYPTLSEEEQILASTTRGEKVEIRKILSGKLITNLQKLVGSVAVSQYIIQYAARLVRATRPRDDSAPKFVRDLVDWGAGPRAGQYLIHGGKAQAAMDGRFSVSIDDIRACAIPVLRHRISTNFQAQAEGMTNENVIERLLKEVPTPPIEKLVKN